MLHPAPLVDQLGVGLVQAQEHVALPVEEHDLGALGGLVNADDILHAAPSLSLSAQTVQHRVGNALGVQAVVVEDLLGGAGDDGGVG